MYINRKFIHTFDILFEGAKVSNHVVTVVPNPEN